MTSPFLGEFLGTAVLILLGNGVVAGVVLKKSKAEASGWIVITAGWALAVMAGVFTSIACGSSDAHLNPAVTIGFAVRTGNYEKVLPYLTAQILGAIVGATLVWIHYLAALARDRRSGGETGLFLHGAGDPEFCAESGERNYRDVCAGVCGGRDFLEERGGERARARWARTWLDRSCGVSVFRLAGRLGTRSTRRATLGRGWRMRCCQWRVRPGRTGVTRRFPYWDRSWAECSRESC